MRRLIGAVVAVLLVAAAGCAAPPADPGATPQLAVEGAWVRTTVGAKDTSMTAAFLTVVNPGTAEVRLTSAQTAAAGEVQLHEMVKSGDRMAMQEARDGIAVPAGGHVHLTPGGYHVMLMQLRAPLAVGDEVELTLRFSDGTRVAVTAPVKEFVEEEDHYHSPEPSPSS